MEREQFEFEIGKLVQPLHGQRPRPWMTKLTEPHRAEVFVVGHNQRSEYLTSAVSHDDHFAALFNRPPGACRCLYNKLTEPSRTRLNIDDLVRRLEGLGVHNILETNVIPFSTRTASDVPRSGAEHGKRIFRFLLKSIDVRALIVHSVGAVKTLRKLESVLGDLRDLPCPPNEPDNDLSCYRRGKVLILTIPNLSIQQAKMGRPSDARLSSGR